MAIPGARLTGASGANVLQRGGKMVVDWICFRNDVSNAGLQSGLQQFARSMQGEHQHGGLRSPTTYLACGLKPVHYGHLEIQEDYGGAEVFHHLNGDLTVLGFAAYFPIGISFDPGAEGRSNDGAIVNN